jgi:hypothetical protein
MNEEPDKSGGKEIIGRRPRLMSRAYLAHHEALGWLAKLDVMAKSGNPDAIRMFHSITCRIVQQLNEHHAEYSASVLEWPILLPQDPDARNVATKHGNAMRIGSVRGGGEGSGRGSKDILTYDSQKGFSIINLRRLDYARAILRPIAPAYKDSEAEHSDDQVSQQIKDTLDDPSDFAEDTQIANFGEQLLIGISQLPDYSPDTREDWIRVMVAILRRNKHLVPEKFKDARRKDETYTIENRSGDEVEFTDTSWQGALLTRTLRDGLKTVSSVPGFWGQ